MISICLLNCFSVGAKPLEGAKNWFCLKKLLGPTLLSGKMQVTDCALKALLPAPNNSGTFKIPAPLRLILKSFYSVIIIYFFFFLVGFFLY